MEKPYEVTDKGVFVSEDNYSNKNFNPHKRKILTTLLYIIGIAFVIVLFIWISQIGKGSLFGDKKEPIINLVGDNPLRLTLGQNFVDPGAKAIDNVDGDITTKVVRTGEVDIVKTGTYVLNYVVSDEAGNNAVIRRTVSVLPDTEGPDVKFNPNGNSKLARLYVTAVSLYDPSEIKTAKYQWTTSTTTPSVDSFKDDMLKTGQTITTPNDVTGEYYLWVYAVDNKNNAKIISSKAFNLSKDAEDLDDKKGPLVTFGPDGNALYAQSHSTTITVIDDKSGIKTAKYQWTTSTTVPNVDSFKDSFVNGETKTTPKGAKGQYYLWVYTTDNKGNVTITSSKAFNLNEGSLAFIDNEAPKITMDPSGGSTPKTSYSIKATIKDASEIITAKYKWTTTNEMPSAVSFDSDVINGKNITTPSGAQGNYYLWIYAVDSANNSVIEGSNVFALTKSNVPGQPTPPDVSFNPNGSDIPQTSYNVNVYLNDADGIKVAKYKWTTSTSQPSAASFSTPFKTGDTIASPSGVTGDYYLWIYAEDIKGAVRIIKSKLFKLAKSAPVQNDITPPTAVFSMNGNGSYAKSYSTVVTVSDDISGVKTAKYLWTNSIDVPAISSFADTFVSGKSIASPSNVTGSYYLWIYAEDNKGNVTTTPIRTNLFNIDNTAPACSTSGGSSNWYNDSRTIQIACSDGNSGVSLCNGISGNSASATYSSNTNQTYSYTVTDTVGNSNSCKATVRIDKTKPSCSQATTSSTPDLANIGWITGGRDIKVSCSDSGGSGLNKCWGVSASERVVTYADDSTEIATDNVTVTDNAGNSNTCTAKVYVDNFGPGCDILSENITWTNKPGVYVKANCKDSGSGVASCGGSTTLSYWANTYYTTMYEKSITITDKVGHSYSCPIGVYLDTDRPNCYQENTPTNWTTLSRKISVRCTDDVVDRETEGSGLKTCFKDDQIGSHSFNYLSSYTFTNDYNYGTATVSDNAGNSSSCSYKVLKDGTAPAKPTISQNDTKVTVTCGLDSTSGTDSNCLLYCLYKYPNTSCTPSATTNNFHVFTVGPGWALCVRTVDRANNKSGTSCIGY